MKKFSVTLILAILISLQGNAQLFSIPGWDYNWDQKAHEKGQIHFSYGYGQPRLDRKIFELQKDSTDFRVVGIGPFFWKAELGLSRKLSVLLSASYILYKSEWYEQRYDNFKNIYLPYKFGTQMHDMSANLRFNYHMYVEKDWDIYIGGGAGYNYVNNKDFTTFAPEEKTFKSHFRLPYPVSYEMSVGFRYYFLTRTAIYLEAGIGKTLAQGGFVFKFRHRKRG